MLMLIKERCGHCSNEKWWKYEEIKCNPTNINALTCFYCGYVFYA